jgi:alcohol dehydrogenase (NADP+)
VESHPLLAQNDLLKTCNDLGVVMTAYSPIGSPGGAGSDSELSVIESPDLKAVGERKDASAAQIALAWAVQRGTAAIPKSTNKGRIKENLAAADIELSDEEMKQIDSIDKGHRFIEGDSFAMEGSPYTLEWLWEK